MFGPGLIILLRVVQTLLGRLRPKNLVPRPVHFRSSYARRVATLGESELREGSGL